MKIDDLKDRLDSLWAMLEEEGFYTKANTVVSAKNRIEELESNLAKALECLKFYAENKFPDDYPGGVMYIPENSDDADYLEYCLDYGDKARTTLRELRES